MQLNVHNTEAMQAYKACERAIEAVLVQNKEFQLLVEIHVTRQVVNDLGPKTGLARPVASLISELPACALLNALYSTSVLRHYMSDAIQIVKNKSLQVTEWQRKSRYYAACMEISHMFFDSDDEFRKQIGEVFYEAHVGMVGLRAGKITGMLISMPICEIERMMGDYSLFIHNTQSANDQLEQENLALLPSARYLRACWKIMPSVVQDNPNYKQQVGDVFHQHGYQMISNQGVSNVNAVISMLIDRPIDDIKQMMMDFTHFQLRISQASDALKISQYNLIQQKLMAEKPAVDESVDADCESVMSTTESV